MPVYTVHAKRYQFAPSTETEGVSERFHTDIIAASPGEAFLFFLRAHPDAQPLFCQLGTRSEPPYQGTITYPFPSAATHELKA